MMDVLVFGTAAAYRKFREEINIENLNASFLFCDVTKVKLPITLKKIKMVIILPEPFFLEKPWFSYLIGVITTLRVDSFFYLFPDQDLSLPDWIDKRMEKISDPKIFFMKLKTAYQSFLLEELQLKARRELLNRGFFVNVPELCECLTEQDMGLVQLFLQAGFSPSCSTRKGVPMLAYCLRKGAFEAFNFLVAKGADVYAISQDRNFSLVMEAASIKNAKYVQKTILFGIDVNVISKEGQTALMLAVSQDDPESCRLLLEAGADKSIVDSMGMTAFDYGNLFGSSEVKALLAEK